MKTFGVVVLALVLMVQAASAAEAEGDKRTDKGTNADSKVRAGTPVKDEQAFSSHAGKAYLRRPSRHSKELPRWSNKPAGFKDKKAAVKEEGFDKGVKSVQSNGPQLGKAGQSSEVRDITSYVALRSLKACRGVL